MVVERGDIFYADLRGAEGSEQGGIRPVVILQNNVGNKYSPTVICSPMTTSQTKSKLPTHVEITANLGMPRDSVVLLEQVRTIDKKRLKEKITCVGDTDKMDEINKALMISYGIA